MITKTQFGTLEDLFNFYNIELFNEKLPDCLVNLSRHKGANGFFAPERWKSVKDKEIIHEISLNPDTIHRPDIEWHSTLVHEMVHLWQQAFGKPSRVCYHNREWADKMELIGLLPTDTGEEGGKKTGQHMTHLIIKKGKFEEAFNKLSIEDKIKLRYLSNVTIKQMPGTDEDDEGEGEEGEETGGDKEGKTKAKKSGVKFKYTCECGFNVWGKSGLKIKCEECNSSFIEGN